MEYQDFHMHGGVVEDVQVNGDLHMHGGVIERLVVKGDCQQFGGIVERRVIMGGGTVIQQPTRSPKTRVIYKDRVEYRDRIVYRDREKVVYRDRTSEDVAKELRTAKGQAKYWLQKAETLEGENARLRQVLEDTERQKLLDEIDDLREKLKKARQRENVAVQARKDAERRANQTIANVWDQYRPTKEACKQLYENLKAFLDCETE